MQTKLQIGQGKKDIRGEFEPKDMSKELAENACLINQLGREGLQKPDFG